MSIISYEPKKLNYDSRCSISSLLGDYHDRAMLECLTTSTAFLDLATKDVVGYNREYYTEILWECLESFPGFVKGRVYNADSFEVISDDDEYYNSSTFLDPSEHPLYFRMVEKKKWRRIPIYEDKLKTCKTVTWSDTKC